jgi:hypothetical protein
MWTPTAIPSCFVDHLGKQTYLVLGWRIHHHVPDQLGKHRMGRHHQPDAAACFMDDVPRSLRPQLRFVCMTDLVRKPKTLTTAKVATGKGQVTFSASGVR